jgi:hypothetical protein
MLVAGSCLLIHVQLHADVWRNYCIQELSTWLGYLGKQLGRIQAFQSVRKFDSVPDSDAQHFPPVRVFADFRFPDSYCAGVNAA